MYITIKLNISYSFHFCCLDSPKNIKVGGIIAGGALLIVVIFICMIFIVIVYRKRKRKTRNRSISTVRSNDNIYIYYNIMYVNFKTMTRVHVHNGTIYAHDPVPRAYSVEAILKPGAHWPQAGSFLKLFWFKCQYVCMCLLPRALITSGMIWCDVDRL